MLTTENEIKCYNILNTISSVKFAKLYYDQFKQIVWHLDGICFKARVFFSQICGYIYFLTQKCYKRFYGFIIDTVLRHYSNKIT